jgi:hypothetical protein
MSGASAAIAALTAAWKRYRDASEKILKNYGVQRVDSGTSNEQLEFARVARDVDVAIGEVQGLEKFDASHKTSCGGRSLL